MAEPTSGIKKIPKRFPNNRLLLLGIAARVIYMETTYDYAMFGIIGEDDNRWEFRWNGSHTVNVFLNGHEVDVFSYYDENGNPPTLEVVERLVGEYWEDEQLVVR